MSLISRATQVSRAVKNVRRLREIVSAMTRFGFGTVVNKLGLKRFVPSEARTTQGDHFSSEENTLPVRLRLLCEQLGPTFIKVGQILAGRPDLVPPDMIREFSKLQDQVAPVPFNILKSVIERELERSLDDCFSSFDTEPMATASIAQVHAARTLDGDDVVVKIQKPDVVRLLSQDLEILEFIAGLLEKYIPEIRPFRPRFLVEEFKRTLLSETNFTFEASNVKRFRQNFNQSTFLVIPRVYDDFSSSKILTLERLRGAKLSNIETVRSYGVDPKEILRQGIDCFFQSIMVDGFFHGDPHAGNILVLPDGRMGLIDFGSVGTLSQKSKSAVINMFLAIISEDYEALVIEYLNLSPASSGARNSRKIELIEQEISLLFAPYVGLPLKDLPMGRILLDATSFALRHEITLPKDLVILFRAIMTLEGIGRSLDPDFDLMSAASKYSRIMLKERYTPKKVLQEVFFLGRETSRFLQTAPRSLREIFRQAEWGELKLNVEISNLEKMSKNHSKAQSRLALAIAGAALLITSTAAQALQLFPAGVQLSLWCVSAFILVTSLYHSLRDS